MSIACLGSRPYFTAKRVSAAKPGAGVSDFLHPTNTMMNKAIKEMRVANIEVFFAKKQERRIVST
jgi:hypothetical protein